MYKKMKKKNVYEKMNSFKLFANFMKVILDCDDQLSMNKLNCF